MSNIKIVSGEAFHAEPGTRIRRYGTNAGPHITVGFRLARDGEHDRTSLGSLWVSSPQMANRAYRIWFHWFHPANSELTGGFRLAVDGD